MPRCLCRLHPRQLRLRFFPRGREYQRGQARGHQRSTHESVAFEDACQFLWVSVRLSELEINKTKPFYWFDASLRELPDPTIRNNLSRSNPLPKPSRYHLP